jgi:hypothetical protein
MTGYEPQQALASSFAEPVAPRSGALLCASSDSGKSPKEASRTYRAPSSKCTDSKTSGWAPDSLANLVSIPMLETELVSTRETTPTPQDAPLSLNRSLVLLKESFTRVISHTPGGQEMTLIGALSEGHSWQNPSLASVQIGLVAPFPPDARPWLDLC